MKNSKFCGNCKELNITEREQDQMGQAGKEFPHKCELYGKRVYHLDKHPNLIRLPECIKATEQTDAPEPRITAARPGNP